MEMAYNKIQIFTQKKRFPVANDLYGLFFEEINRSGDGGLYPEMIRNRSFEDSLLPERFKISENGMLFYTPGGWKDQFSKGEGLKRWKCQYDSTTIPAWYTDHADMTLNMKTTLNRNREASLNVRFEAGGKLKNVGFSGIPCKTGEDYDLYFFAYSEGADVKVEICLESGENAMSTVAEIAIRGNKFQRYDVRLTGIEDDPKTKLCIRSVNEAEINIGFISLMPAETYKNHGLRKDLMEMLTGLNAKFLRFPGGCAVEGISKETSYRFADTLGPVWERKTKQIPWHYRTTNGIGFHEFLQMCEDLGVAAMYVVNCGITCQARNPELFSDEEIDEWIREACEAIDYATADPAENEWAKKRAEAGHPEPFCLKYLEIGNENNNMPYFERYPRFYDVLKKKYPKITFIANTHTEKEGLPTEIVDEHFYNDTLFFSKGFHFFDKKNRNEPDTFVGEYAVTCGKNIADLKAAVSESVFLLGMENNQDTVKLSAYAPLFSNVDYKSWHPNLIEFDNCRVFGTPSYYMLRMLGENRGKEVLTVHIQSDDTVEIKTGRPGLFTNDKNLILRNVTCNGEPVHVSQMLSNTIVEDGSELRTAAGTPSFMAEFPGFAHSIRDYVFGVFGDKDEARLIYEGDIRIDDPDSEVYLTVNNFFSPQLAQIDETMNLGTEWAPDAVDFCSWCFKNGKAYVFSSHWINDTKLGEEKDFEIPVDEFFHFRIETHPDGFDCYLNGELFQQARYEVFPIMVAVASEDGDKIIVKIVNNSDTETVAKVVLDTDVESEYTLDTLGGMDADSTNTINDSMAVIPYRTIQQGASAEFDVTLGRNSLNILTLTKKL